MNTEDRQTTLWIRLTKKSSGKISFVPDNEANRKFYARLNKTRKAENQLILDYNVDIDNPPAPHLTAIQKLTSAEQVIKQQAAEIERLKKLAGDGVVVHSEVPYKYSAAETIRQIKAAKTLEGVDALLAGEDRPAVLNEASRKKDQLTKTKEVEA